MKSLFDEIRRGVYDGNVTSLSQKCEARQAERVRNRMTSEDKLHALSNEGPGCAWVRITPLKWKKWGLKPKQWIVAARRRLNLLVSPYQIKCRLCKGGRCDVKGEHQVTCAGLGSRVWRHDLVRDLLAQELKNAGYEVKIEQNGGSRLRDRAGDILV